MELDDLLIKRKEIPILHDTVFKVPIHPKLLDPTIRLNHDLAHETFPEAAQLWYDDLVVYVGEDEEKQRRLANYLEERPEMEIASYRYRIKHLPFWQQHSNNDNRGFATGLSISRDGGGSLFINADTRQQVIGGENVLFSPEKLTAYATTVRGEFRFATVYEQHNIDKYIGALFLRNWAICYLNAALTEVLTSTTSKR